MGGDNFLERPTNRIDYRLDWLDPDVVVID